MSLQIQRPSERDVFDGMLQKVAETDALALLRSTLPEGILFDPTEADASGLDPGSRKQFKFGPRFRLTPGLVTYAIPFEGRFSWLYSGPPTRLGDFKFILRTVFKDVAENPVQLTQSPEVLMTAMSDWTEALAVVLGFTNLCGANQGGYWDLAGQNPDGSDWAGKVGSPQVNVALSCGMVQSATDQKAFHLFSQLEWHGTRQAANP